MKSDSLLIDKKDGVLYITLNRPEKLNALTLDMKKGILRILGETETDPDVRFVVIGGSGRGFCAGVDLDDLQESNLTALLEDQNLIKELILKLVGYPKPIIAAVNGVAVGIGFSLMLTCDIIIASKSARFGGVWVKRGLHPDGGSTWLLPRRIGIGRAQELLLTGRLVEADEALRIGLINYVVNDAELTGAIREMTEKLMLGAPLAQAWARSSIYQSPGMELSTMLDYETRAQSTLIFSEDCSEAVSAFLGKRPPVYRGR